MKKIYDKHLNALFLRLREQVIQTQVLISSPSPADNEKWRKSIGDEIKIEDEIVKYVAERERRDATL